MALWGNKDSVYAVGVVTVSYADLTVTGSGDFETAGVAAGDVIQIGAGSTFGEAVITAVSSASTVSIASTQFLTGGTISGAAYNINQQPKYALGVGQTYRGGTNPSLIYGVDEYEVGAASVTPYAVTHSGWVSIGATYIDAEGNLRVKHEVLVAGGIVTTSDASDDTIIPDYLITITTQPVSLVGVATTTAQSFTVAASSTPGTTLAYEWQYSSNAGAAYSAITSPLNNVVYTGTTGTTLGIGSTTSDSNRPDGYYYRVKVYSSSDANSKVFSDGVILDYA